MKLEVTLNRKETQGHEVAFATWIILKVTWVAFELDQLHSFVSWLWRAVLLSSFRLEVKKL